MLGVIVVVILELKIFHVFFSEKGVTFDVIRNIYVAYYCFWLNMDSYNMAMVNVFLQMGTEKRQKVIRFHRSSCRMLLYDYFARIYT